MKIALFIAAVAVVTLSSCKKEYTCSCTYTTEQQSYDEQGNPIAGSEQTSTTTSSSTIKDKEKDAEVECEGSNGTTTQVIQNGFYTTEQNITTNCTLK